MCYSKQTNVQVSSCIPPPITWFICQIIINYLSLVVSTCVLNQPIGHCLLSNALNSTITMTSKAKDEMHLKHFFESLMDDDTGVFLELTILASNIKLEVFGVSDSFISFLRTYEEKKTHIMLFFMFDPRFKNLHLVSSYVGKKQGMWRSMTVEHCIPCWSNHTITYILLEMLLLVLQSMMLIKIVD